MRFKLTFILLLANLVVFFVLWRLDRPVAVVPKASGPVARDFVPNHLTIVDHARNETREFKKGDDNHWKIVQPYSWPANGNAVGQVYSDIQNLEPGASILPEQLTAQSYKDFGLNPPVLEITLEDRTHKQTLLVGLPTARGGNVYAMNPDNRIVCVIDQSALASAFAPLEDLRDNNIFDVPTYEAQSLSIKSPNLVKFVKDGDVWQLDTPLRRPADTGLVNGVISQLNAIRIVRFLTPTQADQARPGLANPKLTIELTGESSQTLFLGDDVPDAPANAPEIYAQIDGSKIIFTLPKIDIFTNKLPQAQDALRQRQILDFDPAKVTTLSVTSASGEAVSLERLESRTWQVHDQDSAGAPRPFDADTAMVQSLLDSLDHLTAKTFASDAPGDLAPFGLAAPLFKVVLHTDKVLTLDLGRHSDTPEDSQSFHYFAKVEGADTVYEIDRAMLSQLDARPLHYRDRVLESLPDTAQIMSLKLTHLTDNQDVFNYTLPDKSTWEDFAHNLPESLKREPLLGVRDFVKKFVVQNYRAAAFAENFQIPTTPTTQAIDVPWRYRLEAVVQIPAAASAPSPPRTLTFYFSDPLTPGLQIGGAKEPAPGAVFDLTQYLIGDLGILTMETSVPAVVQQTLGGLAQPINPLPAPPSATVAPVVAPAPNATPAPIEPAAPPATPVEAPSAAPAPAPGATTFAEPAVPFRVLVTA